VPCSHAARRTRKRRRPGSARVTSIFSVQSHLCFVPNTRSRRRLSVSLPGAYPTTQGQCTMDIRVPQAQNRNSYFVLFLNVATYGNPVLLSLPKESPESMLLAAPRKKDAQRFLFRPQTTMRNRSSHRQRIILYLLAEIFAWSVRRSDPLGPTESASTTRPTSSRGSPTRAGRRGPRLSRPWRSGWKPGGRRSGYATIPLIFRQQIWLARESILQLA